MKQVSIIISFFFFAASTGLQAQNCSSYKKMHCDSYAKKYCLKSSAAVAASLDESILKVFDEASSETKYIRKTECSITGSTSYEDVKFDKSGGKFVTAKKCDPSQWYRCSSKKAANCMVQCLQSLATSEVAVSEKKQRT